MLPTFILASGLCGDAVIKNFGDMLDLDDGEVLAEEAGRVPELLGTAVCKVGDSKEMPFFDSLSGCLLTVGELVRLRCH